ncbi:MAG: holin family protein [Acetobacteraceae bacterium]|nr:holin family protein [Acetobacteraceae bacterium]
MFAAALLPLLTPILGDVIKRFIPDPAEQARAQAAAMEAVIANSAAMEQAAARIVEAEAKSEHWLTACWRPIVMLTFTVLIVARWFGWSAPGIGEPEALKLWSIVEFGLGGYVVGRSAEKIVPQVAQALRR